MDVRLHAPVLRDSGKSVVANLCSWGRRCRNSTPNSLRSVCATTTSSSSSNPISSATLMRFSWPITSPLRISRRRYMVKSRIYTVEMTTQFIWSWRQRIVSTKLGRVIIVRGCSKQDICVDSSHPLTLRRQENYRGRMGSAPRVLWHIRHIPPQPGYIARPPLGVYLDLCAAK